MKFFAAVVVILIALSGCKTSDNTMDETVIETTGTVTYVNLEGGFYGIVGEDGTRYDPVNLDERYKEDGLRIRFRAEKQEDVAGIRMWGEIVQIHEIEAL